MSGNCCQEWKSIPVLPLPKSEALSPQMGMRTSLEGTQASGAGESHAQEANVAEVSEGKPVSGEPEYPDLIRTHKVMRALMKKQKAQSF
jgi:hypothetical protein